MRSCVSAVGFQRSIDAKHKAPSCPQTCVLELKHGGAEDYTAVCFVFTAGTVRDKSELQPRTTAYAKLTHTFARAAAYMVTDASLAREERGPYARVKASRLDGAMVEKCPFCTWYLQKWWPHIRAPVFENGGPSEVRLCHLKCAEEALSSEAKVKIEADFAGSLRELLRRSPNLFARRAAARVSLEEERLQEAACEAAESSKAPCWPFRELPPPPRATFAIEGILEMRLCHGMKAGHLLKLSPFRCARGRCWYLQIACSS